MMTLFWSVINRQQSISSFHHICVSVPQAIWFSFICFYLVPYKQTDLFNACNYSTEVELIQRHVGGLRLQLAVARVSHGATVASVSPSFICVTALRTARRCTAVAFDIGHTLCTLECSQNLMDWGKPKNRSARNYAQGCPDQSSNKPGSVAQRHIDRKMNEFQLIS